VLVGLLAVLVGAVVVAILRPCKQAEAPLPAELATWNANGQPAFSNPTYDMVAVPGGGTIEAGGNNTGYEIMPEYDGNPNPNPTSRNLSNATYGNTVEGGVPGETAYEDMPVGDHLDLDAHDNGSVPAYMGSDAYAEMPASSSADQNDQSDQSDQNEMDC
jgi:hypothetical protein